MVASTLLYLYIYIYTYLYIQQLSCRLSVGARAPSFLTVLKRVAKKWWNKKQEAKQKRKRALDTLENIWQDEMNFMHKYKEARAALMAQGGLSDTDFPVMMNSDSSEESCG